MRIASLVLPGIAFSRERWFSLVLSFFSFYLIFGNFLRFLPLPKFNDNLLISEAFLYSGGLLSLLFIRKRVRQMAYMVAIFSLIVASTFYGILLQGWELKPVFYSLRLLCMITTGVVLGKIAYQKFEGSLVSFFRFFVKAFFTSALLGFLIYVFFPVAPLFWQFLSKFGIQFNGDPHQNRFVSMYFDPNMYSVIAIIPLAQAFLLKKATNEKKYLIFSLVFLISILLSWSRSGIATLGLLSIYVFFMDFFLKRVKKIKRYALFAGALLSLIFSCFFLYFIADFLVFWERLIHVKTDASAYARFASFEFGWKIFMAHPLFGVGYNYLALYMEEYNSLSSVDSSPLATLINFGTIPCLGITLVFFIWALKGLRRFAQKEELLSKFFRWFLCYTIIVLFFSSQFNNILYYQFWLLPVISIFSFLNEAAREPDRDKKTER